MGSWGNQNGKFSENYPQIYGFFSFNLPVYDSLYIIYILVGGLEHDFDDFPYIGKLTIPSDELIFFRGVGIPPTSNVNWEKILGIWINRIVKLLDLPP